MPSCISTTEKNSIRHGRKRLAAAMKNKAHHIPTYAFVKGEPLLLDANVWLYLFQAPSDPNTAPAPDYSAAFKEMLNAGSHLVMDPIILSEYLNAYCRIE